MEPTKLLFMVKNAFSQLANVFGKILRILRAELKTRGHTKKEPAVSNQAYRNYFEIRSA